MPESGPGFFVRPSVATYMATSVASRASLGDMSSCLSKSLSLVLYASMPGPLHSESESHSFVLGLATNWKNMPSVAPSLTSLRIGVASCSR